ncbi:hypothetical protein EZ428_20775 [Pedobacter frigiditerrae]|uniref:Lipoprotein n=1 Tax=Pedobacter frigiditerrae TaxID=2530452 RepID=A0A4R0MN21_9SPHI|nr:hypothetical protein [Pedobacter frigiditerrae]TCC88159.1 hypothetical protein EZ428_20775 [Pedobacter frigiditerrae]
MRIALFEFCFVFTFCLLFIACEEKDLYSSKSEDEIEMSSLKIEIDKMSSQVSCDQAIDWKFVTIGSKACGGASGYVAYSVKIDEKLFLDKVDLYTQKQKAFNIKWGVVSDCSLIMPPKAVECINGKPKFVY